MKKNYQQPNIQTVVLQPLHIIAGTGLPSDKPNPGVQNNPNPSRQQSFDVWEEEEEEEQ